MKKLTKEQFFEKYGETKVLFRYYHKRSFLFTRKFQNKIIDISVSASCENILEFGVSADRLYEISRFYDKLESAYIREFDRITEGFQEDFKVVGSF